MGVPSSLFPSVEIHAIALAYDVHHLKNQNDTLILSPCGVCQESILEEANQKKSVISIFLSSKVGETLIIEDVRFLLPVAFSDMI